MRKIVSVVTAVILFLSIIPWVFFADDQTGTPVVLTSTANSSSPQSTTDGIVNDKTNRDNSGADKSTNKESTNKKPEVQMNTSNQSSAENNKATPVAERFELIDLRTDSDRFFQNPDGTITAELQLNNQSEVEINNNLVASTDSNPTFENKSDRFKVKFPRTPDKKLLGFTMENTELGIELKNDSGVKSKTGIEGKAKGDTISYSNLLPSTDFIYKTLSNGVKESITLKSSDSPNIFSFKMNTSNLNWGEKADGRLEFKSFDRQKTLFYIELAYAVDADGKRLESVQQKVSQEADGLTLLITLDKDELKTVHYPVTIDPTITLQPSVGMDAYIPGTIDNPRDGSTQKQLKVKGTNSYNSLIKFNISNIPKGSTVQSAIMKLYFEQSDAYTGTVIAYPVTQEWILNEVTWTEAKDNVNWTQTGGAYATPGVNSTREYVNYKRSCSFDITSFVSEWVNEVRSNNGVILKGASSSTYYIFSSSRNATGNMRPSLVITYTPDTTLPTISVTNPTANATVTGSTIITVTASDASGIDKVEVYAGQALIETKTSTPYTVNWDTTTVANGSYNLWARAYDKAGNAGTSASCTGNVSNTASVTAPGTLAAQATAKGEITLSWGESTTSGAVYRVYRSTTSGITSIPEKLIAGGFSNNTYLDTQGLITGTKYYYRVSAVDSSGKVESNLSNEVSLVSGAPPQAPSGLSATHHTGI